MTATRPPVYNGRYELQSQVARGGTAQVYLARDIALGRPVALKVLFPELSTDHTFVERFRREAQAAANLSHPNIVPVYDWGESDKTYFIVMEYVDGEPLSSIIHTQAPLAPGNAAQIAADIAKALSYAHRHGVVHRDVKPGNVLITSDGQVKVTDFGIARAIGGGEEQVTQTGLVMGTATYFSPEQAQGLDVDGRSDIYALGVVLYEMVTGRPPFAGETPVSIAYKHVQETPPRPRTVNPDIPPALEAIVLQAMAKLPAERYQSADDLRSDLERFLRNQVVLASPPSEFTGVPATEALTRAQRAYGMDTAAIPAAPYEAPRRRTTTPYWIAAAAVLLAAILIVGYIGGRSLGWFGGTHYVKVPYLIGKTTAAAENQLRADGVTYGTKSEKTNDPSKSGTVLRTSPEFPSTVKQGSKVELYIGGKVTEKTIPSVVGLQVDVALQRLSSAGFKTVNQQTIPFTLGATAGKVTGIVPKAGSREIAGTSVTITVIGKPNKVPIPSIAGLSVADASHALGVAGFNLSPASRQKFSSTVAAGDVITSNPAPGSLQAQGTTVELIISKGAAVQVPFVVGEQESDAENALQSAGLQFTVTMQNVTALGQVGLVIGQTPQAQSSVASGTNVQIVVGQAAPSLTTTTTTLPGVPPPTAPAGNTGLSGPA